MTHQSYVRRMTRPVFVGQIAVGGHFPIRVQSMLTSDTKNTEACLKEMQELVAAGCEIIRLTVPTKADLDNLKNIREAMQTQGLSVPLVADIHFTPSIAMEVVNFVEKVRINPGNFVDKKLFQTHEYTDAEYQDELERIEEKFAPLVSKCKELNVAMRIGTNHGSLSDRILNRYGDTPEGMVESALEFLRIAEKLGYYNIILSMKASNVRVMVTAYRLLAKRLHEEKMQPYPFHLGVTEAGEGEDARIKSAMGIGMLLDEGLGDTIRVSLTEDSVYEIPVAYSIAAPYNQKFAEHYATKSTATWHPTAVSTVYQRRVSDKQIIQNLTWGDAELPSVWASFSDEGFDESCFAKNSDPVFEGVEFWPQQIHAEAIQELMRQERVLGLITEDAEALCIDQPFANRTWIVNQNPDRAALNKVIQFCQRTQSHLELALSCEQNAFPTDWLKTLDAVLVQQKFTNVSFSVLSNTPLTDYPKLAKNLIDLQRVNPMHLRFTAPTPLYQIQCAIQLGGLLIDGFGDSVQIMLPNVSYKERLSLSYGILQASRLRMSKTEYIACPSCGRTLFNLQDVTAQIKAVTVHLKGVKIGIMGCIVNGPGEMADADFGYVGTGVGKISLYVGQTCVQRNIPQENAVTNLIQLIKEHGRWVEPAATHC